MNEHFPILIMTGRYAAGKYKIIDFIQKRDPVVHLKNNAGKILAGVPAAMEISQKVKHGWTSALLNQNNNCISEQNRQ